MKQGLFLLPPVLLLIANPHLVLSSFLDVLNQPCLFLEVLVLSDLPLKLSLHLLLE
jgi:hypothetical protein